MAVQHRNYFCVGRQPAIVEDEKGSEDVGKTEQPPGELIELLDRFFGVFQKPQGLPPVREFEHAISLKYGSSPVNNCSYRYIISRYLR